jgi:arylsulfatase A-like enzyme
MRLVAGAAALCAVAGAARAAPPNVLIILLDDLGTADVSYNARVQNGGQAPAIDTPALDALAEGPAGVHMVNAYTHMICNPSRAALVTGRLAYTMGNPFAMIKGGSMDKKFKTVAQELKLRGYATSMIGKWGIDHPAPSKEAVNLYDNFNAQQEGYGPLERGFDSFYGLMSSGHNHFTKEVVYTGAVDWHVWNKTVKLDYPDVDHHPEEYSTHLFTREAVRQIERWSPAQPNFMFLAYTAPHDPLQAPQKYMDLPQCAAKKSWRRRIFCAMVKCVDEGVAEIVATLKRRGLADNTVILFSSDNGGAPSVGGYNYPYHGQKAGAWEGGVRTPAFFVIPKALGARAAQKYAPQIHMSDFAPTILGMVDRAAGADPAWLHSYKVMGKDIDGRDYTPQLLASLASGAPLGKADASHDDGLVLEYNNFFGHTVYLEQGRYKLMLGGVGRRDRFLEPNGTGYDAQRRTQYVVEEFICDIIDRGLGDNWFVYAWAFRSLIDIVIGTGFGDKSHTQWAAKFASDANFGDTIPLTDNLLPHARWDLGDRYVQLYDLKSDPTEQKNIASQNKEMVDAMIARVAAQVKRKSPGHHISVQKQFIAFMKNMVIGMAAALLVLLLVVLYIVRRLCCGRGKAKPAADKKEKKL